MTIAYRLRHARRDLFPIPGARPAADGSPHARRSWRAFWRDWRETARDWFYSVALLLSIAVPIVAVTIIINLRAGMIAWHFRQLMKDRESRCLTVQRPAEQSAEDSLDKHAQAFRPKDREPLPAGVFGDWHLAYLQSAFPRDAHLAAPLRGAYGFREHRFSLERLNGLQGSSSSKCRVRSVENGAPSLSAVTLLWRETPDGASPFHGDGIGEVLIHEALARRIELKFPPPSGQALLAEIGYTPTLLNKPATGIGYDPAHVVRVVGVFQEKVPEQNRAPTVDVFVSHPFVNQLKLGQWYPVPYYMAALCGPLPESGPEPELPAALVAEFANLGVCLDTPPVVTYQDHRWISLARERDLAAQEHGPLKEATWNLLGATAVDRAKVAAELWAHRLGCAFWGPLPADVAPASIEPASEFLRQHGLALETKEAVEMDGGLWRKVVPDAAMAVPASWSEVQQLLTHASAQAGPTVRLVPSFQCVSSSQLEAEPGALQFDRVDLEVSNLRELVNLADAVTGRLHLSLVNVERVKSAFRAIQTDDGWRQFQFLVLWVTGLLAGIALSLALSQRIHQKTSEIGIMRAFGAPFHDILAILGLQTFMLWLGGFLVSIVAAPPILAPLSRSFENIAISNRLAEDPGLLVEKSAEGGFFTPWLHFDFGTLVQVALGALLAALAVTCLFGFIAARLEPARALKLN